tara:strand:+ start:12029 stop:12295 length:267 start_codon:yes stop_codon:yes gene_type:complete
MLWLNILLALAILYVLFGATPKVSGAAAEWTVYGTNGCGWTRKQIAHLDKKGISYNYVECDKEDCGDVNAYPTMKHSNGEVVKGFKEL